MRKGLGALSDLAFLIVLALCAPVAILLVGLPIVLLVRLIVEVAQRL